MPRKFGNEIRLPGTTGIDNLPIPLRVPIHPEAIHPRTHPRIIDHGC